MIRALRRAVSVAAVGWLVWRLFGPDLPPRYRGRQRRPVEYPGRTVFVGGREFLVRVVGPDDGPTVVLVHGWAWDGEMTFHRLVPLLASRFRVVVPDLRNHGKSDRPRGRFDVEDLADELAGMLDAVGVEPGFTLVGYSMGGMVAQAYVHRHPGRVGRLVLAATAAFPIDRHRLTVRVGFGLARAFARVSKKEAALVTHRLLIRSGIVAEEHSRWLYEALMNRDPSLYYEAGAAVWRFDSRSWVGQIRADHVVVVVTTEDRIVPTRTQRDLADRLPDAEIVEIGDVGHEAVLVRPEVLASAVAST